jgi:hypothetical protein
MSSCVQPSCWNACRRMFPGCYSKGFLSKPASPYLLAIGSQALPHLVLEFRTRSHRDLYTLDPTPLDQRIFLVATRPILHGPKPILRKCQMERECLALARRTRPSVSKPAPVVLNNAVSVEQSWAATSCNPLSVRRAGAHPWLGTLNKSLSPLQKRTQGAPDLVRAGVGVHMGRSASYGAQGLERTRMGPMGVPTTRQASCGLAIVTTVAAVGLSLKQGTAEISSTPPPCLSIGFQI